MITVRTFAEVIAISEGSVALVPTMGYLHEGHLSLIEDATTRATTTVVSLFVNPTQFGEPLDLATYPGDEDRDAALAAKAGANILFAPDVGEVYPNGYGADDVTVSVGSVADAMEGRHRPGHFEGVATVVAKLLAGTQPDVAVFGRKDAQQLAVVRRLASSLRIPTEIVGLPTVRERDGLALSSRNARLTADQRDLASRLSAALFAGADVIEGGVRDVSTVVDVVVETLDDVEGIDVEYVAVADASSAAEVDRIESDAFLAVAAFVGGVRLIDNVFIDSHDLSVDRGVRLEKPSILYREG